MFILLGIGVARYTTDHLGRKFVPWPHWAWWVAIVNSWLWAFIAVAACMGELTISADLVKHAEIFHD